VSEAPDTDEAWLTIVKHLKARADAAEMELQKLQADAVYTNEIFGMCRAAFLDTINTVVSPSNFDTAIREMGRRIDWARPVPSKDGGRPP
jgi:hypothetical protein